MKNKSVCRFLSTGAEPLDSIASEMLQNTGYEVTILDRQLFPRTFRANVDAWCGGRFLDDIFHQNPKPGIKVVISSIMAGYTWHQRNPNVKNARAIFDTLAQLCR